MVLRNSEQIWHASGAYCLREHTIGVSYCVLYSIFTLPYVTNCGDTHYQLDWSGLVIGFCLVQSHIFPFSSPLGE